MNHLLRFVILVLFATAVVLPSSAQITITAADVGAVLTFGNTITSMTDTATATANIGSLGSTSWNFSALINNFTASSVSVRPDTTPFFGFFPGATHAHRALSGSGVVYSYLTLGTNLLHLGTGVSGTFSIRIRGVPAEILYQLPMTMSTTWTQTYAESTVVVLPPPLPPQVEIATHIVTYTVEAYGNLTLPGGGVHQALRLKTDKRILYQFDYERNISYLFVARNGASASVNAIDTLQPNTGTINIESASWNGPVSTDVRTITELPGEFALMQNYPNPFNPGTTIQFSLPSSEQVTMRIFNVMGEQIAELVSERLSAGTHEVQWDAQGLPSGVYFCRMQAGAFTQSMRLMLLK